MEHQKHLTGFDQELTAFVLGYHKLKRSIHNNIKKDQLKQKQIWETEDE